METNKDHWVFGYGSLLWKVDFPYECKYTGYIEGFERRFWQNSTDHRGVPGEPGRVVTLIENAESKVWGVAYKLPREEKDDVIKHLNHREKQGYVPKIVKFHPNTEGTYPFHLTIYIGTPGNPDFAGRCSIENTAKIIAKSVGPSGKNVDYFFNLVNYLRTNLPYDKDEYIFKLEEAVKDEVENNKNTTIQKISEG